jgi:hypothetical protein
MYMNFVLLLKRSSLEGCATVKSRQACPGTFSATTGVGLLVEQLTSKPAKNVAANGAQAQN